MPGVVLDLADVVLDEGGGEALPAAAGVALALVRSAQVDDDGEAKLADGGEVVLGGVAVVGGAVEQAALQPPRAGRIAAEIAEVLDAFEGEDTGHGRLLSAPRDKSETTGPRRRIAAR